MVGPLVSELRASLARQEAAIRSSLVLNPVENFPFAEDLSVAAGRLHGLYNSDKVRTRDERRAADIIFAGRQALESDSRVVYDAFAAAVGAEDATLRLLSGLHAHIVLFMALARPGQRVLLLPVRAGGHLSGRQILERLGLEIVDMVVDDSGMCVDVDRTLALAAHTAPDFVFVDRSEGLVVEDFTWLRSIDAFRVFDASQYLANIIAGDHPSPFDAGFDLMVASLHKNFPGPQKAMLATRRSNETWRELLRGVSTFVSNMHITSTYAAGFALARSAWLSVYSKRMLSCAVLLEEQLAENGVPVVHRPMDKAPTHHVWVHEPSRDRAFESFEALEECRILVNYRILPYGLGVGLRLGLNAAVQVGLEEGDLPRLASLIAQVRCDGATGLLKRETRRFNQTLWDRYDSHALLD